MEKSLKTIENLIELVYSELKVISNDSTIENEVFKKIKDSVILSINLKRKVEDARASIVYTSKK